MWGGGGGVCRYPSLGSLPPRGEGILAWKLGRFRSEKFLIIFNTHFYCTDIIIVVIPAFTYFSFYRKKLGPKHCGPSGSLTTSENLVNKVQNIFFFFNWISHWTGHFNNSNIYYYRSFFGQEGGGVSGQVGKIPWAACPQPWKIGKLGSEIFLIMLNINF